MSMFIYFINHNTSKLLNTQNNDLRKVAWLTQPIVFIYHTPSSVVHSLVSLTKTYVRFLCGDNMNICMAYFKRIGVPKKEREGQCIVKS